MPSSIILFSAVFASSVANCDSLSPLISTNTRKVQQLNAWNKDATSVALSRIVFSGALAFSYFSSSVPVYGLDWTDRNRLAAEVWRSVDESFYDRTFNGNDWFKLRQDLVKKEYKSDEEVQSNKN